MRLADKSESVTGEAKALKAGHRLLLFSMTRLEEMLRKGNVDYVRHYERYFDEVYVVYLYGKSQQAHKFGRTTLMSVGTNYPVIDLLLAPIRLFRVARSVKANAFLTADLVFSWWTAFLLRMILRAKVVLMPVCIPADIYAASGRSLSRLPIWFERVLLRLSYAAADRIVMGKNSARSLAWLKADPQTARKLRVVTATVEEFPPSALLNRFVRNRQERRTCQLHDPPRLLYVGRLHPEKLTLDLIDMMKALNDSGIAARLVIAGDGIEMLTMRKRAKLLSIPEESIEWRGFVDSEHLDDLYMSADVFVSTVTGTALREAGLAGLPIAAYNVDWVQSLLQNETTAVLAPAGDPIALAAAVERILRDGELRDRISRNFQDEARRRWDEANIVIGLRETFDRE